MLRATSFFDPTLGRKGIKRTMPLWITHLIIWVMAMPVMLTNLVGNDYQNIPSAIDVSEYVYMTVFIGGTLMACFFCAVIAGVLNNYLMNARSTSFYHALPVERSTIFSTNLIVTLGVTLIPAALVGLMTWLVELSIGISGGGIYILKWWGIYALMCVFFTGFALLCIHVTGHVAAAPIIYLILNFTAVAVETVVRYIPTMFYYGVSAVSGLTWTCLSPIVHIYTYCQPQMDYEWVGEEHMATRLFFENAGYYGWLALAGVVMIGAAWLLYRMRHSEHAGEFIAIRPLRPVFKYAVTLGFTLILSIALYAISYMVRYGSDDPSALWFTVCMLVAGGIGYFGSEMLLRKSFRVWKIGLPGFAVCALLILLGGATLQFDFFGIESYIPDQSKVESLRIRPTYLDYDLNILPTDAAYAEAVELHELIISNEEENERVWNARHDGGPADELSWYTTWVRYYYTLTDGRVIEREYRLPVWKYDDEGDDFYYGLQDVFGYHRLLTSMSCDPVIVHRAYAEFFDEAHLWEIDHIYAHPYNGWSDVWSDVMIFSNGGEEPVFSNALYGALREAVRMDIESGALLGSDRYGKTVEPINEENLNFSLSMEFVKKIEGNGYNYRSHYFTVTPEAVHTYLLLTDPESYVTQQEYDEMAVRTVG